MKNLGSLMKQAKEMQGKMETMQAELEAAELSGESGAGMVKALINGKGLMRGLTIDPSLIVAEEKEVLEDLVVAAINDAVGKMEAHKAEQMKSLTGGLPLPQGMKLPF